MEPGYAMENDDGFNWSEEELLFADIVSSAERYFDEHGLCFEPEEKARLLMALFRMVRDRRSAERADHLLHDLIIAHRLGAVPTTKPPRR